MLISVLRGTKIFGSILNVHAEVQRKIIHTGLGLYALTFPLIFNSIWEVIVLCSLAVTLLSSIRIFPRLKHFLGEGLYGVQRRSFGEIFFAISIGLLFYLSHTNVVLYVLPILILTLSDAAAALIGTGYAKSFFTIENGKKSWEGTIFFFLTAWLLAMITLLALSDMHRESVIFSSFIIAVFGALIEAVSWKGLDNIFVPIGLFLILERLAFLPIIELMTISLSFLIILCAAAWLANKKLMDVHAVNTFVTALFFFWIVGGYANLASPIAVFVIYLYHQKKNNLSEDLSVVLRIISTALFWYIISIVFNYNAYFSYNLSFGLHMVIITILNNNKIDKKSLGLIVFLSWMVTNVRVLFLSEFHEPDIILSFSALFLIFVSALFVNHRREVFKVNRWQKQAFMSQVVSAVGVPLTLCL